MARKIPMKTVRKAIPKSTGKTPSAKKSPGAGKKTGRVSAMWAGRFSQAMSPSMEKLSVSLPFDRKLFREDIEGSIAHAHGLHAAKVLTRTERDRMIAGLKGILVDLATGATGKALF